MSELSPGLGLPYLQPSQAQKHVTHNAALQRLDQLVQLRLNSVGAETPPGLPEAGEMHALGSSATGAWAGQAAQLAHWDGTAWQFISPQQGWLAWDLSAAELRVWSEGDLTWMVTSPTQVDQLGIGTSADVVNRLAISAPATLLSHAGSGHQLKLNKAASGDTASLLFQSNWMGHAELGLVGDTAFTLKLSPDGSSWSEVLRADPVAQRIDWAAAGTVQMSLSASTLQVDVPLSGTAVQSSPDDTTPGRLMRADYGYGPGTLLGVVSESAGQPTGAVIEQGSDANGSYIRWADGSQICRTSASASAGGSSSWSFPASFAAAPQVLVSVSSTDPRFASHTGATAAAVSFDAWDTAGLRVALSCDLIALGRWF